jgi:hypothetical protein
VEIQGIDPRGSKEKTNKIKARMSIKSIAFCPLGYNLNIRRTPGKNRGLICKAIILLIAMSVEHGLLPPF